MISLQKSMDSIEASQALYQAAAGAFTRALGASAEHAVEVSKDDATEFRRSLQTLASCVTEDAEPEEFGRARDAFVEYLRGYQEKAHRVLQRLHQELAAATRALEAFASGVTSDGAGHETLLKQEFERIEEAVTGSDLERIRTVTRGAIRSITVSYENLRDTHALAVAQMRDEIRALQTALHGDRKGTPPDTGGTWEKARVEARLDDLLRRDRPFSLIVAGVGDLARLLTEYSRPLVDHVLTESLTSLAGLVKKSGITGSWGEGIFVAIVEGPPAPSLALAAAAEQSLSGRYILRQNGAARAIRVEAQVRSVDHLPGTPKDRFYADLDGAIRAVTT